MLRVRTPALALVALLAALALVACGGDDDGDSGGSAETETRETQSRETQSRDTATETDAGESGGSSGSPQSNPRAKEITSCLKGEDLNVIINPGTPGDADFQLVVNSGGAGIVYGYADEAAAKSAKGKVDGYEGSSGRDSEVIGDTVYAFFPDDNTLAQPEQTKQVRGCLG